MAKVIGVLTSGVAFMRGSTAYHRFGYFRVTLFSLFQLVAAVV